MNSGASCTQRKERRIETDVGKDSEEEENFMETNYNYQLPFSTTLNHFNVFKRQNLFPFNMWKT